MIKFQQSEIQYEEKGRNCVQGLDENTAHFSLDEKQQIYSLRLLLTVLFAIYLMLRVFSDFFGEE
jgi:hypothetical protein